MTQERLSDCVYMISKILIFSLSLHPVFDSVEEPVQFRSPTATVGVIEHTLEVRQGLLVCFLDCECFPEVTNVVNALQFCDSWNRKL